MSYRNIIYAKLEKRLFNDHRWYMMSETAQLNYIRFILFAQETYNKIPKNLVAIKKAFKTDQDLETIENTIKEIKSNFPKFKENKHYYYFDGFDEKTNYIKDREILRKSSGNPQDYIDKEEDKEKKKIKKRYGEYKNVLLTDQEIEKLKKEYGEEETLKAIQYLSESIEMKGYKYKSHYLAMKKWVFDAVGASKIIPQKKAEDPWIIDRKIDLGPCLKSGCKGKYFQHYKRISCETKIACVQCGDIYLPPEINETEKKKLKSFEMKKI
uniref:Uncharacterized protein n=1 Tax=viral metagenome TaxID=1070528 RepID=A0A6M3LWN0_9ZZZZ